MILFTIGDPCVPQSYLATERICPPDLLSPIHSLLYCEPRLSKQYLHWHASAATRLKMNKKTAPGFNLSLLIYSHVNNPLQVSTN